MCTIEKMLVKGIRSFSPDNNNVIEFYKPLTLIVGSNGAGKTTIIECLKQACTGELPPNVGGNGRNWVMDPKVAGETEVKAQIKLRLRTSVQMPFVVVRSFQSVQKKATLQFKSLDATLQTYNKDTQQKEAITYRCADINTMVPTLMGVSKAVLDNVIFVHQEESNWPLADGATIKKKFDEIFAATKYTKALESLRKLRLEKTQEGREMKLKLETLKSHKDAAQGLQGDLADGNAKAEKLQAEIAQLQVEIVQRETEMAELDAKLNQIADVVDDINKLKAQAEVVKTATTEKFERLEGGDFEEDDAAVEQYLADMRTTESESTAKRESRANELRVKQMDHASYEERIQQAQQQLNRMQAAADTHSSNIADRDAFVTNTAARMGILLPGRQQQQAAAAAAAAAGAGVCLELTPAALSSFLAELRGRQAQLQSELVSLREMHRYDEATLNKQIDDANADLARAQQAGAVKQQDLNQLQYRRENLNQQVMSMASAPYQAEDLQLREEELARRLEAKRAEEGRQNFDAQLAEQRSTLERLAAAITNLRAERDRIIMAGDATSRLRVARNNLAAARSKWDMLLQSGSARQLLELIGNPQPIPHGVELKRLADGKLKDRGDELKRRTEELRSMEAQLTKLNADLTAKRRERVGAESRSQALRAELRRAVGGLTTQLTPEVLGLLNQQGREHEAFQGALELLEKVRHSSFVRQEKCVAFMRVLNVFKEDSEKDCKCVMCNRAFENQEQMDQMLNYVAEQQAEMPQQVERLKGDIQQLDRQLTTMNNLLGSMHSLRDTEDSLPAIRAAEEEMAGRLSQLEENFEATREEVALADGDLMALKRSVGEAGWNLLKQAQEVDELSTAADKAQAQAAAAGGGELRAIEDVDTELADLEQKQRTADLTREDLNKRAGRIKDERVRLSEQLANVREELRRASEANRAKLETQSQLKEVDEKIGELTAAIAAAAAAVGPAKTVRDNLLAQRDSMRSQQLAAAGELENRLKTLTDADQGYAQKQRVIDEYGAAQKADEMRQLGVQLEELKAKRDTCAKEVAVLQEALDTSASKTAEDQGLIKNLEAVLDYRRSKKQQADLEQQQAHLQQQVDQVGDRHALEAARSAAEGARQRFLHQQSLKQGSLSVVADNTRAAKRSLADARYHQIHARYRKQLIELKTTEMAAGDLDKYHKALERALLAFHTGKMSDINKIVKELWQKTYRGQDIDYIQIKADAEGTARSYNYRVVMVNGGVELDMRGRCSAGQKVLACLVIRLALAETFCLNCGILALDEPTTNLDADNSASLADALRAVMTARREQENFQLIVITHDEHFAHMIGTRQHAEYLWRITKDDNQRSHIAQEEIVE